MNLKRFIAGAVTALLCVLPLHKDALARNMQQAGRTDCGVLYVDTDEAAAVKKDGQLFLAVATEEVYTDKEFLASLRQGEGLEDVASAVTLYLFDNRGQNYLVAAHFLADKAGNVCADLGGAALTPVAKGDKALVNAYTLSLKALERKNAWKKRVRVTK